MTFIRRRTNAKHPADSTYMLPAGFALETLWNFWPQTLEYLRLDFGIFDLGDARKPTFGLFFGLLPGFISAKYRVLPAWNPNLRSFFMRLSGPLGFAFEPRLSLYRKPCEIKGFRFFVRLEGATGTVLSRKASHFGIINKGSRRCRATARDKERKTGSRLFIAERLR